MATITGPVSGGAHGWPFAGYFGDIEEHGYVEQEFFLSGIATRYEPIGALDGDGKWAVRAAGEAQSKPASWLSVRRTRPDSMVRQ